MKMAIHRKSVVVAIAGLIVAAPVLAQTPAPAPEAPAAAATHSDPIVQKRMEVREQNRQHRANRAQAKKKQQQATQQSRDERNRANAESRQRATDAMKPQN
ncbi:hypothetical protein [Pandoraea pnomenusa]|uniref:hypothetical protein n=1 Tax=Pandoraea pnomenusa TaxID=93220 RepID=UPI00333F5C2D